MVLDFGMKIFFAYNDELLQLPVHPPEFQLITNSNNQQVETVKLGEINILKDPKLAGFSFDSFFPSNQFDGPYVKAHGDAFKDPLECCKFFETARDLKVPVIFKITKSSLTKKMKGKLFAVEDFTPKLDGGQSDIYYSITFKEFKNYGARKFETNFKDDNNSLLSTKVSQLQGRFENAAAKVSQVANKAVNAYSVVGNTLSQANQAISSIRTTGSIVGISRL